MARTFSAADEEQLRHLDADGVSSEYGERQPDRTVRDGRGQYTRTTDTARRDAEAAELRSQGLSYQAIADRMGYASKSSTWEAVQRALKAIVEEPAENLRQLELQRLDAELVRLTALEEAAAAVLRADHITISHGRVIKTTDPETGEEVPLRDPNACLAAMDRLLKIEEARRKNGESRRKLLGLDAPAQVRVSGGLKVEILGVDMDQLR
ncbi:hypothetical protein ACFWB2_14640 [Streptomyces virginiae]|uniref:hypothetical protein n=1 Tax=Streptomyces TaxID=1883 RepID=UPI00093A030F|nr:hypothetical protein [Streptomyces sp. MJM1172]OKI67560.1 hypothetical protein AMK15_06195 [Streptomyces sp. MJM1172]